MITDFEHGESEARFEADLCIVGTGPAGLALAREFDGSRSSVFLLESGGLDLEAETDALNVGESAGLTYTGLQEGRSRTFGGTSRLWAGQCVRLDEIDLCPRSWVPHSGWPLTLAELDPFYARAEHFLGVAEQPCDERVWAAFGLQAPAFNSSLLGCKGTTYGPYTNVGKHTLQIFKASKNVHVLLHATTTNIVANDSVSAVQHVAFRTLSGKTGTLRARTVVLCCGGIENARLLLLANTQAKTGLGNQHGMVGKFLQEHPTARTATLETDNPQNVQRLFSLFYKNGRRFFPKVALSKQEQRTHELLNGVAYPVYEHATDSGIDALRNIYQALKQRRIPESPGKKLWSAVSNVDQTVNAVYQRLVKGRSTTAVPQRIHLQLSLEQAPNSESCVSLSETRDEFGLPKARVDWRLTEFERRTAAHFTRVVGTEFERVGLARAQVADWLHRSDEGWASHFNDVYHPAGTTRMSASSMDGVVDSDCKVHGVSGLYLAGGSVFPTSGWANPTLTIVALSLRLADHLKTKGVA